MTLSELRTLYIRLEGTLPPLLREGSGADPTLVHDLLLNAIQRHQDAITLAEKEVESSAPNGASTKSEVGSNVPKGTSRKLEVGSREIESVDTSNLKLQTSNLSEAPTSNLSAKREELAWEGRIKINDPRLKDAPPHVCTARNEIKRLMPLISHLHLKLVEASKKSATVQRNTLCKQLRARLEELITRRTECWEILDTFAQEHASGAVTSEKAASPAIRNSSFVIRNSERFALVPRT